MQHVFIVGSKGIPGAYGGYETFVDKLTEYHAGSQEIQYHVACKGGDRAEFSYHNARCFRVKVPNIGPAQAILYDVQALRACCRYIRAHKIERPIVYILACRIGPFAKHFQKEIHKLGGRVFVNPDGHEWLRAKWPLPVQKYWKFSEKRMVKRADLLVCDSEAIERYIRETYAAYAPKTTYIAYGAETAERPVSDGDGSLADWYRAHGVRPKGYYLAVGRFVPENNFETMLREFMKSKTERDFVLITNVSEGFLDKLRRSTGFEKDPRVKFVGTVYDKPLLQKLRQNAYGYFHGHEVGGTNPSLLEALGSTELNLLLDVEFNREVARDAALYWTKEPGNLAALVDRADALPPEEAARFGQKAKARIRSGFSWPAIAEKYRRLFLGQ